METLKHFQIFVEQINLNNGRTYKESILKDYKNDYFVQYYLKFIFNTYTTTGINVKKLDKINSYSNETLSFNSVIELLEYVLRNNTGKNEVIEVIKKFQNEHNMSSDERQLLEKIICKNVVLGVDIKTINKIMDNLIPTFNVQLAEKYFEKPEIVEGKEFYITTKLDGNRIIAMKHDGVVKFYSRNGKEYSGLVDLEDEMSRIMPDDICLDGELIILNDSNLDSKDQFTETQKLARTKDQNKHGLCMRVFDFMSSVEFLAQKSLFEYSRRREQLELLFAQHPDLKYFIKVPVLYHGTDTSKIIELLNSETSHGEEGVMINIADARYQFKRTNDLLKVKRMNDMDLEIIGFETGKKHTKYENTLGFLIVDFNGFPVKVGSGISDELRDEIWNNQNEWLGRTAIVQYFEVTKNQRGTQSLRFPVYIDWRDDK